MLTACGQQSDTAETSSCVSSGEAQKSDGLLKRNFNADEPDKKCVTDITELKASDGYRRKIAGYGLKQSMNSAGGRCHDNAQCESMRAGMKVELFYSRKDKPENYTVEELKTKICCYYMSYWNNRRICSANVGLSPVFKRRQYYSSLEIAA